MAYTSILTHVSQYIQLNDEEVQIFTNFLQPKHLARKTFLVRENEVSQQIAFVTSGCLKAYSIDNEGIEHILQFAPTNWWIADMFSNISGNPGHLNIDAIEDSDVLLLDRADQEKLYQLVPKFERYFRILLEKSLVASRQRVMDNMELTATERFSKFCDTYASLINTVPQKLIASYIGVTPEFLSKIKAAYFRAQ